MMRVLLKNTGRFSVPELWQINIDRTSVNSGHQTVNMLKKTILASALILIIATLSMSFADEPRPTNLKVLSKKISHEELTAIMKGFKAALGVNCGFCHAQSKTDPEKLDFASDENKHKDIARGMMRMTARINKKYFKHEEKLAVTCYTCHNGNEHPKTMPK